MDEIQMSHRSRGMLLESLRRQAGFPSRAGFCRKHGISEASLKHWELHDMGGISKGSLKKLINAFQQEGIVCTEDYLRNGGNQDKGNANAELELNADPNLKTEMAFFYKLYENADHLFIKDDSMKPFLKQGDLVMGLKHKLDKIQLGYGKLCIIKTINNMSFVKFIEKTNVPNIICLKTGNNSDKFTFLLNLAEILYFAPAIWIKSVEPPT